MTSLSSILNTAGAALRTYQAAISVTGQNIANADNTEYSIQTVEYTTTTPVSTDGQIYGTGVTVASVTQKINQLLENRLTTELSTQAALEEELVYMNQIEDLFAEDTDDSLNTLLDNYWSAWESLSNTPAVDTEQEQVYETGQALAERLNAIDSALDGYLSDLDQEISSGVTEINALTSELAALNKSILSAESSGADANDLSDRRNALVDELGALIDIDITVKEDGSYLITTTGGLPLVEDRISHSLEVTDDRIYWCGNSGNDYDITDDISGGSLAGWLTIRDEVIPEISAELDELTSAVIWTMNYQHSQGAGQTYFEGPLEGTYATDDSGTLASLAYGDEIDYSKDFSMVIQDDSSAADRFQAVLVDMGISRAEITDIQGTGQAGSTYEFTVVDEGVLGDQTVAQSGEALGGITASGSVADALDAALGEQTLTITTADGTQQLLISDSGSGATRSAADIAAELSSIDGITAYASSTEAQFSLDGVTQAQDGDIVSFTLYVDGQEEEVRFTVDASQGTLEEQLEAALVSAAEQINETQQNTDLMVDGCTIQSASCATIGIQNFEVIDNAGIALDNFQNFDEGDTLTLTLTTDASSPDTVTVTIDLTDVDTSDSGAVAQAFYDALSEQLSEDTPFTAEIDETTGQVILRTTDGSGLLLSAASGDTGNDAAVAVTALGSSTATGDGQLDFDNSDTEGAAVSASTDDYLGFSLPGCRESAAGSAAALVGEAGGAYDTAAVLTGSVTILMDPDVAITSDNTTSTGLFGTTGSAGEGNSMITLGGTDGYTNFDDGDVISFEIDGYAVSYTVTDPGTGLTDAEQAQQLCTALTAALPSDGYQVIRNGTSITIVRTAEADEPLALTGFTDNTGQDATLAVSTGTGTGAEAPENELLVSGDALNNSVIAQTWGDPAVIFWEVFDSSGEPTGESGYVEIDTPGLVEITQNGETFLTFEVTEGSLVAGNTLRVNTDAQGTPDPLELEVTGTANAIDDTYEFTVTSGGSVPDNGEDIVIEWSSGTSSGTVVVAGSDSADVPVYVTVDGMTLQFNSGTLVEGDVFYVTTDTTGQPLDTDDDGVGTADTLSDWHWTIDSFADEFNRSAGGVTATVTEDNTLVFDTSEDYCAIDNISFSNADGISEENTTITVLNYAALETAAQDLQFTRTTGTWTIANDPTGGTLQIIPEGGDDDGFMVDLDGDGLGDIEISFDQAVSGDGTIRMDLVSTDSSDFSFAFAGDEDGDSGLAAALGLNTFFTGTDAGTIGVNEVLADGDYIASGMVDAATGELSSGDNTNALAMSDTRNETLSLKQWDYTRGEAAQASLSETSLDDYEATLISSIGYTASGIQSSLDYSELMAYQLTEQRDSVSAVSLDEEMIKLTAQQAAYSAAAKLLTVVDEMFEALLAIR